jgi:hypothetical protein
LLIFHLFKTPLSPVINTFNHFGSEFGIAKVSKTDIFEVLCFWHQLCRHPDTAAMGKYKLNCYGRNTSIWSPRTEPGIFSGQSGHLVPPTPAPSPPPSPPPSAMWVADVSGQLVAGAAMLGLRVGGKRAVRARYPNADPETASSFPPWENNGYGGIRANNGYLPLHAGTWTPQPQGEPAIDLLSNPEDWPGVEWPATPIGMNAPQQGR